MTGRDWTQLGVVEAASAIAAGTLRAQDLMQALIARIDERDRAVLAWSHLGREAAMAAARAADAYEGPRGPLHGVPVGIKDVIDAVGQPTEYGSEAFAGHYPDTDAPVTARLRAAGAIIMGKLVTAEFATYRPGPTRNPADPGHTPGGSSSGSAAAVADRQVPLSLGTQTAGSVIRPASFCGAFGFKPSHGRYPAQGVIETSHRLDTVGTFARCVADLALADLVLADEAETAFVDDRPLTIGVVEGGIWAGASAAMGETLGRWARRFAAAGHRVIGIGAPALLEELGPAQKVIHQYECARLLLSIRRERADKVSEVFRAFIDGGLALSGDAYAQACAVQDRAREMEGAIFAGADLILAPSAPGIAPAGLDSTGDPVFCRPWTALGTPSLGFPAGHESGLPLGLQLNGRRGSDRLTLGQAARLLDPIPS
ncbi:amidase [Novosphingobium nitrogenifigens]|uniref:amidase n=1 Tax=Novosphingobium nitrogenifigens TaxID=378548 RepID=UPI0003130927|nr:amidase [Novosphingobium nitrogenifigens]